MKRIPFSHLRKTSVEDQKNLPVPVTKKKRYDTTIVKKDEDTQRPILINFTEAAAILGYKTGQVVKKLIQEDHLKHYKLPDSKRTYVDKKEVEALIQPVNENNDAPSKKDDT